jgi:HlyD family secretion protein
MNKKRRIAMVAVFVIALGATLWTVFGRDRDRGRVLASGTVEATEADLGFQIAGRITRIDVREGDRVPPGAELAVLDRVELFARRDAARAVVDAARAALAEMESGFRSEEVAQGRAALRAAEHRLASARREYERSQRLLEGGAVSQQVFDSHETALELAQAEHDATLESLQILETGPREERITAQRAVLAQAVAGLNQIDAALDHALIRAPFAGVISTRHREPGETVQPGAAVLTLRNLDDRWVRIYVREDEVGRISLGQEVEIAADAYPERTYTGQIVFISNEAEFTPRNVQTTAERVKLVHRVKVQITGDRSFDLKPGVAADVRIDTGPR